MNFVDTSKKEAVYNVFYKNIDDITVLFSVLFKKFLKSNLTEEECKNKTIEHILDIYSSDIYFECQRLETHFVIDKLIDINSDKLLTITKKFGAHTLPSAKLYLKQRFERSKNITCEDIILALEDFVKQIRKNNKLFDPDIIVESIKSLYIEFEHSNQCYICLESLHKINSKKLLCDHTFHTNCIQQWTNFIGKVVCPICKRGQ
jgi:hypothetical protein